MSNDYVFKDRLPVAPLKLPHWRAAAIWLPRSTNTSLTFAATTLRSLQSVKKIFSSAVMTLILTC